MAKPNLNPMNQIYYNRIKTCIMNQIIITDDNDLQQLHFLQSLLFDIIRKEHL